MRGIEFIVAGLIAVAFAGWAATVQRPMPISYLGAEEYWPLAEQLARGERPHGEVPFVYRLGVPWLASRVSPASPGRGFFPVNACAAILTAVLLAAWLRPGVTSAGVRLALVVLYVATWINPVRYIFFNPIYVDPVFNVFVLVGLLLIRFLRDKFSAGVMALLVLASMAGTVVRETMLLVPVAFLFADNPIRRMTQTRPGVVFPLWARAAPLAASIATLIVVHAIAEAEGTRTFGGAALQWLRKPPTSFALACLTVYGPLLAIVLYDWRSSVRFLLEQQHLLAFLLVGSALAYFGGADTERLICWVLPVVYLLLGMSIERLRRVLLYPPIALALVACQIVAARVFWPIPDLRAVSMPFTETGSVWSRIYGVLNRLFVIDDFYWNLMSSYGSASFRILRLAVYATTVAAFMWAIHRRELAG